MASKIQGNMTHIILDSISNLMFTLLVTHILLLQITPKSKSKHSLYLVSTENNHV